ncbi:MAG: hypothetical protein GKS00_13840 [Alphaproteobacteria bacterium]|nr:hypothetical protein [Alphaproteobacteria bacterium]
MQNEWRSAAKDGDVSWIERLITEGHAVDGRDRYGQTALMLASMHGHKAIVDTLIANDADLDVTAKYGLSALMLAIVNHHPDIAASLIEAGANTKLRGTGAPGFAGRTAADFAEEREFNALVETIAGLDG